MKLTITAKDGNYLLMLQKKLEDSFLVKDNYIEVSLEA